MLSVVRMSGCPCMLRHWADGIGVGLCMQPAAIIEGSKAHAGMAEDSLLNQHRYYHYWMLKDNVFSIMKETGTFSRMEKHNVTVIYECYEYMNTALHMGEVYRERRFAELLEHMAGYSDCYNAGEMNAADEMKLIMKDKRFCGYFTRTVPPMAGSAVGICMFTETKIMEVIKMLEAD